MTVHAHIFDIGKVRLVQVDMQRVVIVTQRSSDEIGRRLSIIIRLDKLVYAHVRFERGFYAIKVIECDPCKVFHGYAVLVVVCVEFRNRRFQPTHVTSSMQGQTSEETNVVGVCFGMVGFPFQTDDSFVVLHVSGESQAHTTNGMIDDTIDEEGGICHEFAHPCRIRSLSDGPLQDVGFSDSVQKLVKVTAVCDETGFVQVPSATVTRRVIIPVSSRVLVPQNESVTEINFECSGLLLEHSIQRFL